MIVVAYLAGFEGSGYLGAALRLSSGLQSATTPELTIRTVRSRSVSNRIFHRRSSGRSDVTCSQKRGHPEARLRCAGSASRGLCWEATSYPHGAGTARGRIALPRGEAVPS